MPDMKSITRRTVQDIRTMSERISDVDNPQRKYLTLAMLELEKARRSKEKVSAKQRVANIDQRLSAIEAEQTGLLAAAEAELQKSALANRDGAADPGSQAEEAFRLAY
jgi:hypothetical protein